MTRNRRIVLIAAAAVTVILIIIGIASCTASNQPKMQVAQSGSFGGGASAAYGSGTCVPPLACGPSYAGYVPAYYLAHPSYALLSPYSAFYAPSYSGHSYTVNRTPAGKAPVAARTPMPYPPGYKPVPGDFQPPTAPAKASAPSLAPKPSSKAPEPVKAPAVTTPKYAAPSYSPPKYTAPSYTAPKYTAPKSYRRK